MWRWLLYTILLLVCESTLRCGVTKEFEEQAHINFLENSARGRHLALSRGSTLSPIRIHYHYSLDSSMTTAQQDELKNFLMPAANDYFKKVLRVYPLVDSFVIPSSINECSGFAIPSDHKTTGVSNTDLIVYVTAYSAVDNTVAAAAACIGEVAPAYNIIAGLIKINMYNFGSSMNIGTKVSVLIHEMTHLLGFSSSLFQYFHKPNGALYTSEERTGVITQRGKQVTIAKFPTVVSKARAAFGCSTLEGLELEDQGGSGTAGSHWEKMLMYGDFMQGDTGADDWIFSDITFALLEDSGWYSIDYSQTDSIVWGKNAGCSFFTNKCLSNGAAASSHFCASSGKSCSKNRNAKGVCNLAQYTASLPSQFQYFSDPTIGAMDSLMDYCPIVSAYSNGNCRGLGSQTTLVQPLWGEQVCLNCKCFNSNLLDFRYTSQAGVIQVCYKVRCDSSTGKYYITVGSEEKECPLGSSLNFTGYNGAIYCVSYDDVCSNLTCPHYCLKRGKCVDGECICDIGYGGDYCQNRCDISCKDCSGTASNQCTQCRNYETFSNGICTCPAGTSRNASTGICEGSCNALCKTCTGMCKACIGNAQLISGSITNCECRSGFALSSGACVAICQGLCATCSSDLGTSCLTCKANSTLSGSSCSCNPGYFLSGSDCSACNVTCLSCSGTSSTCTACRGNASLSNGSCTCNSGYVMNTSTGICELACNSLCQSCSGGQCLGCKTNAQVISATPNNCECRSGFALSSGACVAICQGLCATCSSDLGTSCLTCKANSTLSGSSCSCNAGYFLSGSDCSACNVTCLTCSGTSSTCTACRGNASLSNGSCTCNSGYVMNTSTGICELACNSLCQSCSGGQCLGCKTNAQVISATPNNCECRSGFALSSGACVAICQGLCATCSPNLGTSCLTCKANSTLSGSSCSCNPGYFLSGSDCSACNVTCLTCSGTSSTCTACRGNASLSNGSCTCNSGYVMNTSTEICELACNSLCQSCSGGQCLECKTNAQVISATPNNCECRSGFTLSSGACVAICQGLCATCSSDLGTSCLTCKANSTLSGSSCSCNPGYFLSGSDCSACNVSCLTCSGTSSTCTACRGNASLSNGSCTCNSGYVMNTSTGICELACNSLCQSCSGGQCLECKTNAQVISATPNNCECRSEFALSSGACVAICQGLCATCSSDLGTSCLTCKANSTLSGSSCSCNPGYFLSGSDCSACNVTCLTCSGTSSACTACRENASLSNGSCTCNSGYVMNTSTGICELACNSLCQSCSGGQCLGCKTNAQVISATPNNCECRLGFALSNGGCAAICQGLCATCSSDLGTSCLTCKANSTLSGSSCSCNPGYFLSGSDCSACSVTCLTCSGTSSACTACRGNASLSNGSCTCNSGYVMNTSTGICELACNSLCQSCSGGQCLECKTNAQVISATPNNCECRSEFALSSGACVAICQGLCATCSSDLGTSCLTCKANSTLSGSSCSCNPGYFLSGSDCSACNVSCLTCSGTSSTCTACRGNASLSNGSCTCNSGYVMNTSTGICELACNSLCQSCSGGQCLECKTNAQVIQDTPNNCECNPGYYMDSRETVCLACPGLCGSCTTDSICTTCKGISIKDPNNSSACICPSSSNLSSTRDSCVLCPENSIQNVSDPSVCTCISGYMMSSLGECKLCTDSFSLCLACSSTECTSCAPNSTRNGLGCSCNPGFTQKGSSCESCSTIYPNCINCNESSCTQCIGNSSYSEGVCECNNGFYLNDRECISCPALCDTCDLVGVCTQCTQNSSYIASECVCDQGFVASEGKCVPCSSSLCASCTSTGCLRCKENASNTENCECNPGHFNSKGICVPCNDSLCKTCTSADTCTQCIDNASDLSKCTCNSGFFESNGSCLACQDSLCETCNSNSCTKCKSNARFDVTNCRCVSGFFESNGVCVPCDNSLCDICNPSHTCTQCKLNAGDDPSNCACLPGYYNLNGICLPCSNSLCKHCDPHDTCTDCIDKAEGAPNCNCVEGFYPNSKRCEACPTLCQSCDSSGQCLNCKPNAGSNLLNCACIQGYYESNNSCIACDSLCRECTDSICNTCAENASISLTQPFRCVCDPEYYKMGTQCLLKNNLCASYTDDLGCKSCKLKAGSDTSNCTCEPGYYNLENSCVSCGSLCKSCDSELGCQGCVENAESDANDCQCQEGYYESGSQCLQCSSLCKACNSQACVKCVANTNGDVSSCQCASGYYKNDNECEKCPKLCRECSGLNDCTVCADNAEVVDGVCACRLGHYYDSELSSCIQCSDLCADCKDANTCLACKSHAGSDTTNCQCQGRYSSINNECVFQCPEDCETCSDISHVCYKCKDSSYYWPELAVCYKNCPTGSKITMDIEGSSIQRCTPSDPLIFSADFIAFQPFVTSNGITLAGTSTSTQYKRGWYYNGSSSYATFQSPIAYSTNFYIEFWVKIDDVDPLQVLFSKTSIKDIFILYVQNSKFNLRVNSMAADATYETSEKTIELNSSVSKDTWYLTGVAISLNSSKRSIASLYLNEAKTFETTLDTGYILDEVTSTSFYVVGAHYRSSSSILSYFRGFIAYIRTGNGGYMPTSSKQICVDNSDNCLSNCGILEFPTGSSCGDCVAGCTTGCGNSDKCSVHTDPLCNSFFYLDSCIGCIELSYLGENQICRCVENAVYDSASSSCRCKPSYTPNSYNQCILCRDYLTASEVAATYNSDFTAIILTFARSLNFQSISCNDLFKPATLTQLGSNPTCIVSSDKLVITVTLGSDSTFTNESLLLNELTIVGNQKTCRTNTSPIELVISINTPPQLTAFIEAPSAYSKGCGVASSITVSGEKSRFVLRFGIFYTWSVSGSGVTPELVNFISTQTGKILVIQPNLMSNGDINIALKVSNNLGYSDFTSITVSVSESRLLTVGLDAEKYLSIIYGTSLRVAGFISNRCDSTGPFVFKWEFDSSTNTGFSATRAAFSQSENAIILSGSTLPPGYDYSFRLTVSDDQGLAGSNIMTLKILFPDIVLKLNRTSGVISSNSDLSLSAKDSYDPYGASLIFSWKCFIEEKPCTDPDGNPIDLVSADSIKITADKLIPNKVYNIELTISSSDGRIETASIYLETIESPPNSIELRSTSKVSHQKFLVVNPSIQSSVDSTFKWVKISGPNNPVNEGSNLLPTLQFSNDKLIEGANYIFEFSIFNLETGDIIGKASLSIQVNDGPKGGVFTVSPIKGTELSTKFQYTADSFYDGDEQDYPLTYTFSYTITTGESFQLKETSFSNRYSSYLNQQVIQVSADVCDSISTCSKVSKSVQVVGASQRTLQDNLLNKYYELIQDDVDIPGVTSILATSKLIMPEDYPEIKRISMNYIHSLPKNKFNRALYYSILRSFFMNEDLVPKEEVIDYLLTCKEKIDHDGSSLIEALEVYSIFYPLITSKLSDPSLVLYGLEILKNIHWDAYRSLGPSLLPEDLSEETQLIIRAFGLDFLGKTIHFNNFNISYPEDIDNMYEIYDFYTEIVHTNSLPIVTILTSAVGRLNSSNFEIYKEPIPYAITSDNKYFTFELPYNAYIAAEEIVGKRVACTIYSIINKSWSDIDCISEIIDGKIRIRTSYTGYMAFRLVDLEIPELEYDDGECEISPAPFIIAGSYFAILMGSIVLIIVKVSLEGANDGSLGKDNIARRNVKVSPREIDLVPNNTVVFEESERNPNLESQEPERIPNLENDEPARIPTEEVEEHERSPIIKNILNYLKLHLIVELFKENTIFYKLSHIASLFTSMYLGYALIGAIMYSQIDIENQSEDSFTEISEEHYPEDLKYIFIVLGIIIPMALPLRFLIKINSRILRISVLITNLVVMVGSLLGVLLMGRYFCEAAALRWTLAYLIFIPLELSISEFIVALVLFIAEKRLLR